MLLAKAAGKVAKKVCGVMLDMSPQGFVVFFFIIIHRRITKNKKQEICTLKNDF